MWKPRVSRTRKDPSDRRAPLLPRANAENHLSPTTTVPHTSSHTFSFVPSSQVINATLDYLSPVRSARSTPSNDSHAAATFLFFFFPPVLIVPFPLPPFFHPHHA